MKTIEEKAKRYDEAIERAKNFIENGDETERTIAESIFAGLMEESEDERIIKDIVTYLKSDIANKGYRDKIIESWIAWLENAQYAIDHAKREGFQLGYKAGIEKQGEQKPIKEHNVCDFCEDRYGCVNPCPTKLIEEQKPADFSDLRTWKYIVDAVWTEKEGIGQYLDSPFTEEVAKKLQKRFGKIEQKPAETEKGVKGNFREIPFSEQKPADNIEPKFHEGEWIIHHGTENIYQVVSIIDNQYQLKYGDNYTIQNCADVDRCARLWDITKDAKDGDVIYSRHNTESFEWIGIFKSLDKENKRVFFYGFWHDMAKSFSVCGNEAYVLYDDFSPATKEQRDTLKKAMADAGYSFDFEKKELKKIEQKPADNIEKPWSEDDEVALKDVCDWLDRLSMTFVGNESIVCQEEIKWLKSLKDRIQPKVELTQLDKNILEAAIAFVAQNDHFNCWRGVDKHTVLSALHSLRPKKQWKPSKEQMEVLNWCKPLWNEPKTKAVLESLIEDLKKLMEE